MLTNSDVTPFNRDDGIGLEAASSLECRTFFPVRTVLISCEKRQSEILILQCDFFTGFQAEESLAIRPLCGKLKRTAERPLMAECGNFYCVLGMVALLFVWEPVEE